MFEVACARKVQGNVSTKKDHGNIVQHWLFTLVLVKYYGICMTAHASSSLYFSSRSLYPGILRAH